MAVSSASVATGEPRWLPRFATGRYRIRKLTALIALHFLAACSNDNAVPAPEVVQSDVPANATPLNLDYAETFKVYERDGYRIVDLRAPLVSWGGAAQGGDRTARIILVPKTNEPPPMTGDLADAVLVRTPVERVAVNYGFLEAILTALEIEDRLVAVGGVKNYNDGIRARARSGEIAQVGYGWHSPPSIDPLIASEPDVFLMVMGDLGHAEHYERIKDLGVPVVPIFFEAELTYMGPVDYVRLIGMMTGMEAEADRFVAMVAENVDTLKALVTDRPRRKVMSSWYGGSGRWMVTVRNADGAFLRDAGGINVLAEPDDVRIDDFVRVGTEVLLEKGRDIDCWIIRDTHSVAFNDIDVLQHFKAWREGCLFAGDGMAKPEADAFDVYERGLIRPDLILGDMVRMLYPELRDEPFVYYRPDTQTVRP